MSRRRTPTEALRWVQEEMRRLDALTEIPVTVMRQQGAHSYGEKVTVILRTPKKNDEDTST